MGISMKHWLLSRLNKGKGLDKDIEIEFLSCPEIANAMEEYRIRALAFDTCVNMIAGAVGKFEFKTFVKHQEVKGKEYYTWNVSPNPYQNSTTFLHKLIYKLYSENQALVIYEKGNDGREFLYVADGFSKPQEQVGGTEGYKNVVVGETTYTKTFPEGEVLRFQLSHNNIKPVLDGLCQSYHALTQAAMKNFTWANGKHFKVHVGQIAQGGKDWNKQFQDMINAQVKPFFLSEHSVLPEFEGYDYQDIGGSPDSSRSTRDIRALTDDIFEFTARCFSIPPVLLMGDVAGSEDAMNRWLTTCIDPLRDQIQEEIIRKRYGYSGWNKGNYLQVDASALYHFDVFQNAANVEKLIGSGVFSVNDIRQAAGLSPIQKDWAQEHYLTLNISSIRQSAKPMDQEESQKSQINPTQTKEKEGENDEKVLYHTSL